jgi:hypothetical protein
MCVDTIGVRFVVQQTANWAVSQCFERYAQWSLRLLPVMEGNPILLSHVVGGESEESPLNYHQKLPIYAARLTSRGHSWGEVTAEDCQLITLHLHRRC